MNAYRNLRIGWSGKRKAFNTTPKSFLLTIYFIKTIDHSIDYIMKLIKSKQPTLFEAPDPKAFIGLSRLHEPVIEIEPITPSELQNECKNLTINYSFAKSPFGDVIIASTQKGICYLAFIENEKKAFANLQSRFPSANYNFMIDEIQQNGLLNFHTNLSLNQIKLHLNGTSFQLKVWTTLLKIPMGYLSTYGEIAMEIGSSGASRAVGSAIGKNPVAFIIPCHRVVQASGNIGGYRWGSARKVKIIDWESANIR